jgi:hypothetical protein
MREENRNERREAIEAAAYESARRKGLSWYVNAGGGAQGEGIERNALSLVWSQAGPVPLNGGAQCRNRAQLARGSLAAEGSAEGALQELGPLLLSLLTGDRAITLNRAAAADPSGELAQAIVQSGREAIAPLYRAADVAGRATKS